MEKILRDAFNIGYERMAGCADLVDRINVFPVADGDTGLNMKASLAPLHQIKKDTPPPVKELMLSAKGCSGNIAASFFSELLMANTIKEIPDAVKAGRENAWRSVANPQEGTILSVMDELALSLEESSINGIALYPMRTIRRLEKAVLSTRHLLPVLEKAGVVDSGALALFLFMEGFLSSFSGNIGEWRSPTAIFRDNIRVNDRFFESPKGTKCIDFTLDTGKKEGNVEETMFSPKDTRELIVNRDRGIIKVHLHSESSQAVRKAISSHGKILNWKESDADYRHEIIHLPSTRDGIHIMTDAAASISRDLAKRLGIILMDSYILMPDIPVPETSVEPQELYHAMNRGMKVKTAQASVFERFQCYDNITGLYGNVLYLTVGSAYTGNYHTALQWKEKNDPEDSMTVIDTKTACGRLAVIAIAASLNLKKINDKKVLVQWVKEAMDKSDELIFLDTLKYLKAGGRISRAKGFFGEILHLKPAIRPGPGGAEKAGTFRNRIDQERFAISHIKEGLKGAVSPLILLEYTDNYEWIKEDLEPRIRKTFPSATVMIQPFSLTSGAHMGPGTWGVAFIPGEITGARI